MKKQIFIVIVFIAVVMLSITAFNRLYAQASIYADVEITTDEAAQTNGTMIDRRIPEDDVDRIFKRFEAIENGDIAAFRSTLGEMQDGVDYYYQLGLLFEFFGDFFDIDSDTFDDAVANGSEELPKIANTLFNSEHPLKSRNTGLSIKKMEIIDTGGLRVIATNNKNEETIYVFTYW